MARESGIALFIDSRKAETGAKRFERSLDRVRKTARRATQSIKKGFGGLKSAFGGLRGAIAALGFGLLIKQIISVNTNLERMRGALTTITGSTELANREFQALQEFAKSTPFTLDQSVNAFIKLQNLGIRPTEERLRSFGNTAAAQGKSLSQFIEAVADASTMEFERLKEFGIKARQQADSVSFTFQNVTTTVGKNSEEITEFLENIGDTNFAGAMENQMSRLPGVLSNLQDSFTRVAGAIGEGGFTDGVIDAANALADFNMTLIQTGIADTVGNILGESFRLAAGAINLFTGALEKLDKFLNATNIFNRIAAGMDLFRAQLGGSDKDIALTILEQYVKEINRMTGDGPDGAGDFKIGDSLGAVEAAAEGTEEKIDDARVSLEDYVRETAIATQEIERQIAFIREQGNAFDEQSEAFIRLNAQIEAERQLREAGIPIYEQQGKTLENLTNTIVENVQAQQVLDRTLREIERRRDVSEAIDRTLNDLAQERDALLKINDARQEGVQAYRDAVDAADALNITRRLGISLTSAEGSNIQALIKEINGLQEELNDPVFRTWKEGAIDALEDYRLSIQDVGSDVESAMTNAIRGMEDTLTEFFTKGKADFEAFSQSIVADINRILIRQMFIQPLIGSIQAGIAGAGGGAGLGGFLGGIFGGGKGGAPQTGTIDMTPIPSTPLPMANGGVVSSPTLAMIGEGGGSEAVIPLRNGAVPVVMEGGGMGGNMNITVTVRDESGGRIMVSERQIAQQIGAQVGREMRRERGA